MAIFTSLPQQPPGPPTVAATPHGWLPGRTIEKSAHQDKVQAQRIIAAAKARATLTVTDTIDSLASNVGAQVKGRVRALSAG